MKKSLLLLLILGFNPILGQWQKISEIPTLASVISHNNDTTYLGMGREVLISTDEGFTWESYAKYSSESVNKIIIKDNLKLIGLSRVVYGFDPIRFNMFRSLDYGKTWDSLYVLYNGNYYSSVGISDLTLHNDELYCGINGRLLQSTDFGDSWFSDTVFVSNVTPYYPISLHSTGKHFLVSFSEDSLYIKKEGMHNWNSISEGLTKENIYNIEGKGDTILIGGLKNIYVSFDAGDTWQNITNNIPDSLSIYGLYLFDSKIYLTTNSKKVFFSYIDKFVWSEISNGLENLFFDYVFDMTKTPEKLIILSDKSIYSMDISNIVSIKNFEYQNDVDLQLDVYPNPFNNIININYSIPSNENVTLEIYNVLGERVKSIIENTAIKTKETISFNANIFSSGVYYLIMRTNSQQIARKIVLIK